MLIAVRRLFEIDRDTAMLDVVASAIGAGIGGRFLVLVNDRTRASVRLANRLSLEIPLIGLIYLLLPLLIATSVSAGDDIRRLLMLLPLGFLAARLLSGVQEHHFGPARVCTARGMSLVAAGWMTLGVFPALLRYPPLTVGIVAVSLGLRRSTTRRAGIHGDERRYEADILKSAMPYVAVYFLDVVFLPLAAGVDRWHFQAGLTGGQGDLSRQIVRLLEPVTSLALLAISSPRRVVVASFRSGGWRRASLSSAPWLRRGSKRAAAFRGKSAAARSSLSCCLAPRCSARRCITISASACAGC